MIQEAGRVKDLNFNLTLADANLKDELKGLIYAFYVLMTNLEVDSAMSCMVGLCCSPLQFANLQKLVFKLL